MSKGFIVCETCQLIYPSYIDEIIDTCPRCSHKLLVQEKNRKEIQKAMLEVDQLKEELKRAPTVDTTLRIPQDVTPEVVAIVKDTKVNSKISVLTGVGIGILLSGIITFIYLHSIHLF